MRAGSKANDVDFQTYSTTHDQFSIFETEKLMSWKLYIIISGYFVCFVM